jgi:hypothetical protein
VDLLEHSSRWNITQSFEVSLSGFFESGRAENRAGSVEQSVDVVDESAVEVEYESLVRGLEPP